MALTYGFYNSKNHDRVYDAIQFGSIFDGLITDGVYGQYKNKLMVKDSNEANTVIIQSGRAWFNHTWSYNDANVNYTLPAPDSNYDRIDAVVLEIDLSNDTRRNRFYHVKGTAATNPVNPTWTNSSTHFRYPLAYVYREKGKTTITRSNITNNVGNASCPLVYNVAEGGVTVDELLAQWTSQWNEYMSSKTTEWSSFQIGMESKISRYETLMENEFYTWLETQRVRYDNFLEHNGIAWDTWFSNIRYQLDGDVAGHLQLQIDEIAKFAHIYVVDKVLYVPMSGASVSGKKLIFATC